MTPHQLPTRALGTTGADITAVGFGAWATGGPWTFGWGAQDDHDSIAAIHHALDLGINWVDTAPAYGLGHSEEVVARAVRGLSEPPYVFTKCGLVWHDQSDGVPRENLRPAEIRKECDDSLTRLGVERIDLLQFHWPDVNTGTPVEESWGAVAELVSAGKVRWVGVSNFGIDLLERCEAIHHVDTLQPPLNLVNRQAAELLGWCRAHGTGVLAYSPMMSGLLTERFSHRRLADMDPGDWRRSASPLAVVFREPHVSRNIALRDTLAPIAARHGTSVGAVAVAWVLAWPQVTGAIVGARTPAQVDGWIDGGRLRLEADDLDEIAQAVADTNAGDGGPALPPMPGR